jgi:hypothetical protein
MVNRNKDLNNNLFYGRRDIIILIDLAQNNNIKLVDVEFKMLEEL